MSIYLVSDLHGAADALKKAVPESATLVLLGDLINLVDYSDLSGILTEVFPVEAVASVIDLRTAGDVEGARRVMKERSAGREDEIREEIGRRVREQYEEVFANLSALTYVILGNVDQPQVVSAFARSTPGVALPDGEVVTLEGERFGFVGGALPTALNVPGEIPEDEMRRKVEALGECDVLCSHIPPAVPELCCDTIAGKSERGSEDLLRYIEKVQPRRHYFGHVHQPLVSSMDVGKTLCINVGYFRATERAWPHSPVGG